MMASKFYSIAFLMISLILASCNSGIEAVEKINESNKATETFERGFTGIDEITIEKINQTLMLAGQYLLNNQKPDGSLQYLYFPQAQQFSSANNMIRQWMSTIALAEMRDYTRDEKYGRAFEKNMEFNFRNSYPEDGALGHIPYGNESKLGAAAFALTSAIKDDGNKYSGQQRKLTNLILYLHNPSDGSFRTFYFPKERNDNQNFYPGEAMLALMILYEEAGNETYLGAVRQSFDYYSAYHRKNPNPAFVPWHTMALYRLYQIGQDARYSDFIFDMNDFLITIQNKSCSSPGNLGRFYDPKRGYYGPPHASSDAVYVEGLTYAYRLAKELGREDKAESYKEAIILGTRSLVELQYKEAEAENRTDAYILLGGIRTSTERPEIRIDNSQHTIMALLQVLHTFSDDDLREFIEKNPQYVCP